MPVVIIHLFRSDRIFLCNGFSFMVQDRVLYEPSFSMLKINIILKKVFNLVMSYGISNKLIDVAFSKIFLKIF